MPVKMARRSVAQIYIVLILSGYCQANHWTMFERSRYLDGLACHPDDVVFEVSFKTVIGCAAHCRKSTDCLSIFYDNFQFICFGCKMSIEPEEGKNKGLLFYERMVCPPINTFKGGKSCYLVGPTHLNFTQAMDFCSTYNRHLLQVETPDENHMFLDVLSKSAEETIVWLGLTDIRELGTWVWETSQAVVSFEFWNTTAAENDPNHRCGAFILGIAWSWEKIDCSSSYDTLTICEVGMLM